MFRKIHALRLAAPAVLFLMCVLAGCATSSAPKDVTAHHGTDDFEHTVRWPGESLAAIAKWYTGDSRNWTVLAKENPSLNPSQIRIGDIISIPRELMTKTDPMPRSYVKAQAEKPKRGVTPQNATEMRQTRAERQPHESAPEAVADRPTDASYEPELFGPKE